MRYKQQLVDARQTIALLISSKQLNEKTADPATLNAVANAIDLLKGDSFPEQFIPNQVATNSEAGECNRSVDPATTSGQGERSDGLLF